MSAINSATGKRLIGREILRQNIRDILTTPKGSRIMRRDYGSLFFSLIDQPLNGTNLLRVYAATVDAIARWEPGIKVQRVTFSSDEAGSLTLALDMTDAAGTPSSLSVPLGLKGATT